MANGKPSESGWEFFKIENEQIKTAQNNPYGFKKKWTVNDEVVSEQ